MYFKLKPTRNNKKKFKKEKIDNNNEEKIKHLELENESLKSKINELKEIIKFDLKEIIQIQSNQIVNLKLKLNKYESKSELKTYSSQNEDETSQDNQSEQTILILEPESSYKMSVCESETDSDQSDDETNNKVIHMIFSNLIELFLNSHIGF